jgi:DNA-binding response OmpR family regulator
MKKQILIVDDEVEIRELLSQFLQRSGFDVNHVGTASEALARVKTAAPDLVISDLQLEHSDGLEMIARIKEISPVTPVLLLTSLLFDEKVIADNLSKKVSAYLPKTTPLNQILAQVKRLLA